MASMSCMNGLCGASTSIEWRKGWTLRSGDFANLCDKCGSAYEQSIFCDVFHSKDSGWRECTSCGKRLHCGCIASRCLLELLDGGGVNCISCARKSGFNPIIGDEKPNGFGMVKGEAGQSQSNIVDNQLSGVSIENLKFIQLRNNAESLGLRQLLQLHNDESSGSLGQMKQEEVFPTPREIGSACISNINQASNGSVQAVKPNFFKPNVYEPLPQPNLSISLGGTLANQNAFSGSVVDEKGKMSSVLQQASKSRHLLPKPPKSVLATGLEVNAGMAPQIRVARPPAEGRGRNQLLPRYWPRITDQELQQISGEMYVLEGVTPCIQSMQLQAGDTVTFSRMDPEGKLVMGFRKATNNAAVQETLPSAIPNGTLSSESFFSGVFENLPIISGYSGLLQSLKGSNDPHLNALSKHLSSANGDISWQKSDKHEDRTREGLLLPSMLAPERKRTRNIGSKSKRLLIDSQDALELKLTWEEAQDLLRPPPSTKPSVVTIEDHDFEEYDEPPVFGKRSIFSVRSTGSSCSAPDELTPRELENLLRLNKDFKKRRTLAYQRPAQEHESSGLDALANAAILGDNVDNSGATSVATTTRHPRHRPGCSCIVCIQPPSGKARSSANELESKSQSNNLPIKVEANKGGIDLNCDPDREDDSQLGTNRVSMMSLLQVANLPLETYLKENGLTSLVAEQQANSSSHAPPQTVDEGEAQDNNSSFPSPTEEHESREEENGDTGSDRAENNEP
ncbi:hypothetical protein COLO4_16356 [Corchorus olitorius]|uniref:VAL1-3 N-terminal zinc finger domain-containing protein n=1 Tax=Corchorus olitorius TaxID=93759 RepID=A0A1R3JHR4_9ROSI|nr:hypothetical protein COLO4_16356 [Corchorus olitorius]